jgi:hypothetical protein
MFTAELDMTTNDELLIITSISVAEINVQN